MIKIENVDVFGWKAAIRGMRSPLNSWDKSDSDYWENGEGEVYSVGNNDLALMKKLAAAGTDHRKFMRMINVTCDITAPLYWWKEADTYKVGTVRNSCSTMHTITKEELTLGDFSHEHLMNDVKEAGTELLGVNGKGTDILVSPESLLKIVIGCINNYRMMFIKTGDKVWWNQLIQLMPSSYNQRSTVQLNYEVLANMYHSRRNHKLDEWREFCRWVESLPYSGLITGDSYAD